MQRLFRALVLSSAAALLSCSDGLQPIPFQGVSGRVVYRGSAPASTEWVRIGVFEQIPSSILEFQAFAGISDSVPTEGQTADYAVPLDPGIYRWLLVVWKEKDVGIPDGLRVLGWYTAGDDPFGEAQIFEVGSDEETAEIDPIADFDGRLTLEEALEALK